MSSEREIEDDLALLELEEVIREHDHIVVCAGRIEIRPAVLHDAHDLEVRARPAAIAGLLQDLDRAEQMVVGVRLEDIRGVERLDPILHHAAIDAVDDANRQAGLHVLARRHDILCARREEARPGIDIEIVEAMGISHLEFGDPVAQLRRILRLGGVHLRDGSHSSASAWMPMISR